MQEGETRPEEQDIRGLSGGPRIVKRVWSHGYGWRGGGEKQVLMGRALPEVSIISGTNNKTTNTYEENRKGKRKTNKKGGGKRKIASANTKFR